MNNLLIVEDNTFIRKEIFNAAKKINTIEDIHAVESLQEAISVLSNYNIKLITLDLNLPDGNGLELLRWSREKHIVTKILVFSSSIELKQFCLNYGVFAFYDKNKDFEALIEALQ